MKHLPWKSLLAILALVLAVTFPATKGELLNYDDERYVSGNPWLGENEPEESVFTAYFDGHYHPLTLISLQVDETLGEDPVKAHHKVNWLLHGLNAVLVYLFLLTLTGNGALAFWTALLFGLHPVAVESYAWITERKNLLYTSFFLLSARAWVTEGRKNKFPVWALVFFVLSCLSKAQGILLVPVFFLLDWWEKKPLFSRPGLLTKLPFVVLALGVAWLSQEAQAATWELGDHPYDLPQRLLMAAAAFLGYLFNSLLPVSLSPYYPYPLDAGMEIGWMSYAGMAALSVYGFFLFRSNRRWRVWFFGLAFFGVNIVLLLKFLEVPYGRYFMANRYAYLPLIGLLLPVVDEVLKFVHKRRWSKETGWAVMGALALVLTVQTRKQLEVWNNSTSLWTAVISHYPAYAEAYNMRALGRLAAGDPQGGEADLVKLGELKPDKADGPLNLAVLYDQTGRTREAGAQLNEALRREPEAEKVLQTTVAFHQKSGNTAEARRLLNRGLELYPESEGLAISHVQLLAADGRLDEAIRFLSSFPSSRRTKDIMGKLQLLKNSPEAREQLRLDRVKKLVDQATALSKQGQLQEAEALFNEAIEQAPNFALAYVNRGSNYGRLKNYPAARRDYEKALKLNPQEYVVHAMLGGMYREQGDLTNACLHYKVAKEHGITLSADVLKQCGL